MFPNAQRINRGHYDIKKLIQACKANDVCLFICPRDLDFLGFLSLAETVVFLQLLEAH